MALHIRGKRNPFLFRSTKLIKFVTAKYSLWLYVAVTILYPWLVLASCDFIRMYPPSHVSDIAPDVRNLDITNLVIKDDADPIGRGSMGDVFSGRILVATFEQKVAIKTLRGGSNDLPVIKRRLLREVATWSRLVHRNVATFYGLVFNVGVSPGLVSPLLKEKSLNYLLRNPDLLSKRKLVREVAEGLNYLHESLVVHGDVKPDNVLMTASGVAQIIDFGLAQIVEVTGFTTIVQRNARYTAPELLPQEAENQSSIRPTYETDVFSFSMFMLEAISGPNSPHGSMPYNQFPHFHYDLQLPRYIHHGIRPRRDRYNPITNVHWDLMCECWRHPPEERPSMGDVLSRI